MVPDPSQIRYPEVNRKAKRKSGFESWESCRTRNASLGHNHSSLGARLVELLDHQINGRGATSSQNTNSYLPYRPHVCSYSSVSFSSNYSIPHSHSQDTSFRASVFFCRIKWQLPGISGSFRWYSDFNIINFYTRVKTVKPSVIAKVGVKKDNMTGSPDHFPPIVSGECCGTCSLYSHSPLVKPHKALRKHASARLRAHESSLPPFLSLSVSHRSTHPMPRARGLRRMHHKGLEQEHEQ